jgi:transmembrane sensor
MSAEKRDRCPVGDDAAIEAAAVSWLCERDDGFAPERATAFAVWCAADPRHRAAVAKVERGLDLLHELPAARFAIEARLAGRLKRASSEPRSVRISVWAWPTGLAAAMLVGAMFWGFPLQQPAERQTLTASAVAPARAVLGDGSVVNVNTQGKVEVQLGTRERRVTLAQGEAHFEVKSDPARPFIVVAGGVTVRAVGTMFAVRLGGESVEVLVEEGQVTVAPASSPASVATAPAPAPDAAAAPLVCAGDRAVVPRANLGAALLIEKMEPSKMGAALQWHRRVAAFNDTPLQEVIAQFNRRNAVQISLADDELGVRRFGGALALDQVDALLRLLEREGGIAVERHGAREIVLRRVP